MKSWLSFGLNFPDSFEGERLSICPKCSHARRKKGIKCLSANGDKKVFICHHCGYRGSLEKGVEGHGDPYQWKHKEYQKPVYERKIINNKGVRYLIDRGIDEDVIEEFGVGYDQTYIPQLEEWATALKFPFYKDGEIVNVKSRDGRKNFRLENGAEKPFYNYDSLKETELPTPVHKERLSEFDAMLPVKSFLIEK